MAAHTGQPARSRRFIKVYLSTWALLASGALAYLAVLAFPPQTAAPPPQARLETPREPPRSGTTEVEVRAMKGSLSEIRKDMSQLQEVVGERVINEKVVQTRLTALEERVSTIDPQQPPDAPAPDTSDKTARAVGEPPFKPAETAATPAPAPVPKPIETGSIIPPKPKEAAPAPKAEIVFGAPVVTRADAPELAVQLAAGPSVQALKQSWGKLSERHADALSTLQPRVVPPRGKARNYRLIAGPVATEADAARICTQLGAAPQACFVTPYAGAPL